MKVKHILVLIIAGAAGVLAGALFKIQHWPGASVILLISLLLEIAGAILAIWKLLTFKGKNDFLEL